MGEADSPAMRSRPDSFAPTTKGRNNDSEMGRKVVTRNTEVHELRDSNIYTSKSLKVFRFYSGVGEASFLLGYFAASLGNRFPMFRDNVVVPFSTVEMSKKKNPLRQLDLYMKFILQGVKLRPPHLISLPIAKRNTCSKVT
jgi:hypothetical protein